MREKESHGELLLRNEDLLKTGYNPEAEVLGDGKKIFSLIAARVGNAIVSNSTSFLFFPIFSAASLPPQHVCRIREDWRECLKGKSFCSEGFYVFL